MLFKTGTFSQKPSKVLHQTVEITCDINLWCYNFSKVFQSAEPADVLN